MVGGVREGECRHSRGSCCQGKGRCIGKDPGRIERQ